MLSSSSQALAAAINSQFTTHLSLLGYMPRNRRFGFITQAQLNGRTIAHELGHGAFNLSHTFPVLPKATTDNLMDYNEGSRLIKPQWDLIHNPELTTGLLDDESDGASKTDLIVRSTDPTREDFLEGSRLDIEGNLLVMNDPNNKFVVEINCDKDKAVAVEWTFEDPNLSNATLEEAFQDGAIKLGKNGDVNAVYWAEADNKYALNGASASNTVTKTKIVDSKSAIQFSPSGVGGDDYFIVANILDANGKTLKKVKSKLLTVVRKIKFENLYHMKGGRDLTIDAAVSSIQPYFKGAYIIYEVPNTSVELSANYSLTYLCQYDKTNAITHQYDWKTIANLVDYDPSSPYYRNSIRTEKLTVSEQANCSCQSVSKKVNSWAKRLSYLKDSSLINWLSDASINNLSIVSIYYYHIMYGNDLDPDMNYNPFPCSNVKIDYLRNGPYLGSLWDGPVLGVSLGNGNIAITKTVKQFQLKNTIAHEIAHSTMTGVNGRPIMYRNKFGLGDHTYNNPGLMNYKLDRQDPIILFNTDEILILRGYKL